MLIFFTRAAGAVLKLKHIKNLAMILIKLKPTDLAVLFIERELDDGLNFKNLTLSKEKRK